MLSISDQILLIASKLTLQPNEVKDLNKLLPLLTDWNQFAHQAIRRGLAGLFYVKIPLLNHANIIPASAKELLEQTYFFILNRNIIFQSHFQQVAQALQLAGIEVTALKGILFCETLYHDLGLRQMSDIDLLIRAEQADQAVEILSNMGYDYETKNAISDFVSRKSDFVHRAPMFKQGVSIELHVKLHKSSEKFQLNLSDVFSQQQAVRLHGVEVFSMDISHNLIHVALHAHKHFVEGNVQFNSFADLVNLILTLPADFDWLTFENICKKYKVEKIIFGYLLLVQKFYGIVLPSHIEQKYQFTLTADIEQKFIHYLHGYKHITKVNTAIPAHLSNLKLMNSPMDKLLYCKDLFFPPRKFMLEKYAIKHANFYWLYYPYRYFSVLKGLREMRRKRT
ncbi:MAG: hypothetical protein AUK44_07540 [Porphyromonadaceae bacterium CG2_30_38_12]|nr:MAG: hypothetical protein AUK44_07540 [Porphyromonadaceae bacterium CG2_30_38_12]